MNRFDDDAPLHRGWKSFDRPIPPAQELEIVPLKDVKLGEEAAYLLASARYTVKQVTQMMQEAEEGRLYGAEDENVSVPISPNQIAATLNSLNAIIKQIFNMRAEIINMERIKRLEEIILECLEPLPDETKRLFFEKYKSLPQE